MATVLKADDPGIGRDVAIKFLHASLCEDEGCRIRFLREAGAAGRLSHPNIAIVHDVGEIEGRPYMAMELLTGESLADELEEKKPLPIREVISVGIEQARALDFAHSKVIVHRDIKPGNILRLRDSRTIKVTDFGIAHIDNPNDQSTDRAREGEILGTPRYMSLERARVPAPCGGTMPVRCFAGAVPDTAQCVQVLTEHPQRRQWAAAVLMRQMRPDSVLFNCAAPTRRQQRLLAEMRVQHQVRSG